MLTPYCSPISLRVSPFLTVWVAIFWSDETVAAAQSFMAEASAVILNGFQLRSDVKIVRYPDRYMDERGVVMWDTVQSILDRH